MNKRTHWILAGLFATGLAASPLPTDAANEDAAVRVEVRGEAQGKAETPKAAFLGVGTAAMEPKQCVAAGLPAGVGLRVMNVEAKSPAEDAGLKTGDVLHKINDQLLINPAQLAVLVRTFEPDDTVKLTFIRDGETHQSEAALIARDLPVLAAGGENIDRGWRVLPGGVQLRELPLKDNLNGMDLQLLDDPDIFQEMNPGMLDHLKRMEVHRNRVQELHRQLRERMQMPADGELVPPAAGIGQFQSKMAWSDGEHNLQITKDENGNHLNAQTMDGEMIYDGPLPADDKLDTLPESIRHKVAQMQKMTRVELNFGGGLPPQPQPQPREKTVPLPPNVH